jgi:aminoglycoside 3-N-acetyltransferase
VNPPYDSGRLVGDLASLGVAHGDVLFVHASFKSLGQIDGGATTVVQSLELALGQAGLLLMPSFNLIGGRDQRAESWDIKTSPSTVGWLTEYFRSMPGTFRSDHYSHSVAARGRGAEAFVADHLSDGGMASPWDRSPWGKTYGADSPMIRAYDRGGKILMIGVDYETSTYCHVVEATYWALRLQDAPAAGFVWLDRDRLGGYWEQNGKLNRGMVGDADCRLIDIRTFVDDLLEAVKADPDAYDRVKLGTR